MKKVCRREFTVVEFKGRVKILDSFGRSLAIVDAHAAIPMTNSQQDQLALEIKWRPHLQLMAMRLSEKIKRLSQTEWEKKCGVWQKSLRWRRNRKPHERKTKMLIGGRARNDDCDWDTACHLFMQRYANKFYEKQKRARNPWRLWAQTVYSNLGKQRDIVDERSQKATVEKRWQRNRQPIDEPSRKATIQMLLQWDRDNAEAVFA